MSLSDTAVINAIRDGRAASKQAPDPIRAFLDSFNTSLHRSGFAVVPLPGLDGIPPSNPNPYSIAAARDIRPRAGSIRYSILSHLHEMGPMTSDELEQVLGRSHQTISARLTELSHGHYIEPTGESRQTASGSEAAVYRPTGAGLDVLPL